MAQSYANGIPDIQDLANYPAPREKPAISCYENEIPPFVAQELERRYACLFASLPHFQIRGRLTERTSTYVTYRGDEITNVFLFERVAGSVTVLNDLIALHEEDVRDFTDYVFAAYDNVNRVSFPAIQTRLENLPYPYQQFFSAEDIAISLPDTPEKYLKMLGKNTRRNIKRYNEAIIRAHPTYSYRILAHHEITDDVIRHIIRFNRVRMANKKKVSSFNQEEEKWILALTKDRGLIGVAEVDGKICAGSICYRVGDNYFMLVIAHDPAFNEFSLGTLCCYQTICECLTRGGKELHFMWGRLDYKYMLLGVQRAFDRVDIYRSRKAYLLNGPSVIKTAICGYLREAKFWVLDLERRDDATSKMAKKVLNLLRISKRTVLGVISKAR